MQMWVFIVQKTNFDIEPQTKKGIGCASYEGIHMKEKTAYVDENEIRRRLTEQLFYHRKKLGLKQIEVAGLLDKAEKTYQCWESTGNHLTNIFDILKVFQVLKFSTVEVIGVLGLPLVPLNEIKDICQDEAISECIKGTGICSYCHKNCCDMNDFTIERLLDILFTERLKRHKPLYGKG